MGGIRVLLVDDSPTVRAVLRRLLSAAPDLQVVGDAADGRSAVELAERLRPDVVLMDITMPELDGFEATSLIMEKAPTAILVFSTVARMDGNRTIFEAFERGARSVLAKPESPAGWTQLAGTLPELVRSVAQEFRDGSPAARTPPVLEPEVEADLHPIQVLAVGASTGGPEALRELLGAFAPRPPTPVLVVQHIACEFEEGLAEWLRGDLAIDVAVARDGERMKTGTVRLAPQGSHLRLEKGWLRLDHETAPVKSHRPSADVLFSSCAAEAGSKSAGILLSGMGRDGVAGLLEMRQAGGITLVQDRASCVVYGMPQAALDAGAADLALSPEKLAQYVLKSCGVLS